MATVLRKVALTELAQSLHDEHPGGSPVDGRRSQLPSLRFSSAEPRPQRLLLQHDGEPPAALVDDALTFHAGRDCGLKIIWSVEELDPEREHGGGIFGCLEQAGYDVVLVNAEQFGPLVQRNGMGSQDPFHASPGLPPEFKVSGLNGPGGRDQIGDLVVRAAGPAPATDILVAGGLHPVLDLAHPGEMLASRGRQGAAREAGVLAEFPETRPQRLLRLLGRARGDGSHGEVLTASILPRRMTGRAECRRPHLNRTFLRPGRFLYRSGTLPGGHRIGRSHSLGSRLTTAACEEPTGCPLPRRPSAGRCYMTSAGSH